MTPDMVYDIFKEAFGDDVWDRQSFMDVIQSCDCLVNEDGAILYRTIARETEILNLAVRKSSQNKGVATALVMEMIEECMDCTDTIFLEVAKDNTPAIHVYKKIGFKKIAKRDKYYHRKNGDVIDAIIMSFEA